MRVVCGWGWILVEWLTGGRCGKAGMASLIDDETRGSAGSSDFIQHHHRYSLCLTVAPIPHYEIIFAPGIIRK